MLGERDEQKVEHAQREPDECILNRVQQRRAEDLPEEEHEEREREEEHRVFHGALGLLIDVDRLNQRDAER